MEASKQGPDGLRRVSGFGRAGRGGGGRYCMGRWVGVGRRQGTLEVGNETRRRLTRESLSGQSRPREAPVPAFGAASQPPQSPAWVPPEREQKEEAVEVTLHQPVSGWQGLLSFPEESRRHWALPPAPTLAHPCLGPGLRGW